MQNNKYIRTIAVASIFLIIYWCITVMSFIIYAKRGSNLGIDDNTLIINILLNDGMPESILTSVLFIVPFTMALNYLICPNSIAILVRCERRGKFVLNNIKQVIVFSLYFVVIHELINTIGLMAFFDIKALMNLNYFMGLGLNILGMVIFFIGVGGTYLFLCNYVSSKFAGISTLLINFVGFFLVKLKIIIWVPCVDSKVWGLMPIQYEDFFKVAINVMTRNLPFCIIMLLLYSYIFMGKDILNNER